MPSCRSGVCGTPIDERPTADAQAWRSLFMANLRTRTGESALSALHADELVPVAAGLFAWLSGLRVVPPVPSLWEAPAQRSEGSVKIEDG